MANQVSVSQARDNLRYRARQTVSKSTSLTLSQAKNKLRLLDEELDLPPLVPHIDQGRWKDALYLSASWSVSAQGVKLIYPVLRKFISLKLFS